MLGSPAGDIFDRTDTEADQPQNSLAKIVIKILRGKYEVQPNNTL